MPKVSVVIPTYNRGRVVGEAIESVLAQTFGDFEVIVVDDGSADDTAEKIAAIRDSRVRYIRQSNAGVSAARNRGVAEARGEIISFLDSDDLWKPEKLTHEVRFLEEHPEVPAVFGDIEVRFRDGAAIESLARHSPRMLRLAPEALERTGVISQRRLYLMLFHDMPAVPTALSIRATAFRELGGFDTAWNGPEDLEFLLRYARRYSIGYIPVRLAVLRHSADSLHLRVGAAEDSAAVVRGELRRIDPADREAVRYATAGVASRAAWARQLRGKRVGAVAALLGGFARSGDTILLARALIAALPWSAQARVKRALGSRRV